MHSKLSIICLQVLLLLPIASFCQGDPVSWTGVTGVTLNADNSLTKTAPYGYTNAGAASVEVLAAGADGWVEMTAQEVDLARTLGLTETNSDNSRADINFGIELRSNGIIFVYEDDVKMGFFGEYGTGDRLKVARNNGVITYWKNDTLKYTSPKTSTTSLVIDASLQHVGATVAGVIYSFDNALLAPDNLVATATSPSEIQLSWSDNATNETGYQLERSTTSGTGYTSVASLAANSVAYNDTGLQASTTYYYRIKALGNTGDSPFTAEVSATTNTAVAQGGSVTWTGLTGVTLNVDNSLTKTAPYSYTNAGAASVEVLAAGADGWVEMTAQEIDLARTLGLTETNSDNSRADINFGIELRSNGIIFVYEDDVKMGFFGEYGTGDRLKVARNNGVITYWKNDTLKYTSPKTSTTSLVVDASLQHVGATIAGVIYSFDNSILAPDNLMATAISPSEIQLTWSDNSTNETGYQIERSTESGTGYASVANLAANTVVFNDAGLQPGTTYYYRVKALGSPADSPYTPEASVITHNAPPSGNDNSWLEVTADGSAGRGFAMFYDNQKSTGVQQDVKATGNTDLEFYVKTISGTPDWSKLEVRLTVRYELKILYVGDYQVVPVTADWTKISIPLDDFGHDPARWDAGGVSDFQLKAIAGFGAAVFGLDEIRFTGGTTPFVWYGDAYTTSGEATSINDLPEFRISNRLTSGGYIAPVAPIAPDNLTATVINANSVGLAWSDRTMRLGFR